MARLKFIVKFPTYLAVLLPVFPLALSSFKLLLLSRGSIVGLFEGLVVSAAALLCPGAVVVVVDAGLLMAPLYRFRNEEVAVVSMACGYVKNCIFIFYLSALCFNIN